ncbi:MAG: right-handed parallel beta-helix repeat-containing protein [Betaproteobacteria bacterium]|nr:right-handed parallel beta-helix repeat-containing protein [Betaproteobacteria bacterium]
MLRGLTINGQGGNRGIVITSAGEVAIEQCTVANMGQDGIQINGGARVHIRSSTVRSNGWRGLAVLTGRPRSRCSTRGLRTTRLPVSILSPERWTRPASPPMRNFAGIVAVALPEGATVVVTVSDSVASEMPPMVRTRLPTPWRPRSGWRSFAPPAPEMEATDSEPIRDVGTVFLSVSDSVSVGQRLGTDLLRLRCDRGHHASTFADNVAYDIVEGSTAVLRTSGNNTLTGTGTTVSGAYTPNPLF